MQWYITCLPDWWINVIYHEYLDGGFWENNYQVSLLWTKQVLQHHNELFKIIESQYTCQMQPPWGVCNKNMKSILILTRLKSALVCSMGTLVLLSTEICTNGVQYHTIIIDHRSSHQVWSPSLLRHCGHNAAHYR